MPDSPTPRLSLSQAAVAVRDLDARPQHQFVMADHMAGTCDLRASSRGLGRACAESIAREACVDVIARLGTVLVVWPPTTP